MAANRRYRWYFLCLPLIVAVGLVPALIALLLLGPTSPEAHGAGLTAKDAAGFQTTEKLVVTVNLPAQQKKLSGTLRVELVGPDDKVLPEAERDVKPDDAATTQRFEFATPKTPADKVKLRCQFGKEKPVEVPLNQVLLVKAHETTLASGKEFYAG